MSLKGSKTEENLKAAFAGESQANRRYLYFAQKADVEGHNDVAAVFRSTAEGETGRTRVISNFLRKLGIQQQESLLEIPLRTLKQQLLVKLTSTRICTQEWRKLPEMKVLMRLLIGLKH